MTVASHRYLFLGAHPSLAAICKYQELKQLWEHRDVLLRQPGEKEAVAWRPEMCILTHYLCGRVLSQSENVLDVALNIALDMP